MDKEILTFGDIENEKNKFYRSKLLFCKKDVEIQKVLVSDKDTSVEKKTINKYFIGYPYNDNKVRPLHIMLAKTSDFVKGYDGQAKWLYFLLADHNYLENIILFGIKSALI